MDIDFKLEYKRLKLKIKSLEHELYVQKRVNKDNSYMINSLINLLHKDSIVNRDDINNEIQRLKDIKAQESIDLDFYHLLKDEDEK